MFDLKKPCSNCPFLIEPRFYFSRDRAQEIADSMIVHDAYFPCHKTTSHDDEGDHVPTTKEQHCAGALIILHRMQMPNQLMRVAYHIGSFDPEKLHLDDPNVYQTMDEFVDGTSRD